MILENILSHTLDSDSIIIADMVAGTDAFQIHYIHNLISSPY